MFSLSANGQLKMPRMGNFCVTFMGDNAGFATGFDVAATSSQAGHSASSVADGDSTSFWASAYDPAENAVVDVQLNLGSPKQIHRITIDWEYPATAFEVQVAKEGSWTTIYATSGNNLNHTTVLSLSPFLSLSLSLSLSLFVSLSLSLFIVFFFSLPLSRFLSLSLFY